MRDGSANQVAISQRPLTDGDLPLLRELFASTRELEMAALAWNPALQAQFLDSQLQGQQQHYHQHYPNGSYQIIEAEGRAIGNWFIDRGERTFYLIDITLLPDYRGQGIGSALIAGLLEEAEAAGKPVQLFVYDGNQRARQLYDRFGFVPFNQVSMYTEMEWNPVGTAR